jgi:hypothetical protein
VIYTVDLTFVSLCNISSCNVRASPAAVVLGEATDGGGGGHLLAREGESERGRWCTVLMLLVYGTDVAGVRY